jgi:hypothetical protein
MPRANKADTDLREALEGAAFAVSHIQLVEKRTRLRVRQARDRTGMTELLGGALDELGEINQVAMSARIEIDRALRLILE